MIQAHELRINNTVCYTGSAELGPVYCHIDEQDISECAEKTDRFNKAHSPIRLTSELLSLLGALPRNHPNIMNWTLNGLDFIEVSGRVLFYPYQIEVRHLHDLQNLHYCCRGEELPIDAEKLNAYLKTKFKKSS